MSWTESLFMWIGVVVSLAILLPVVVLLGFILWEKVLTRTVQHWGIMSAVNTVLKERRQEARQNRMTNFQQEVKREEETQDATS